MISRNNNSLDWNASQLLTPALLPYFVERVAEEGGNYLIVNGDAINVKEAIRFKAIADEESLNARMYLAMSEISSNASEFIGKMMDAAFTAGTYYRFYARSLNMTENPIGVPLLLSSHPELNKFFNRAFAVNPFDDRDYN